MGNDIIIYNTEDGKAKINLQYEDGTVWLSQLEIAELFQTTKQNVSKHVKALYLEGELEERATVNYKLTVQQEGNRKISRKLAYYNLDMILAIGYRVRSIRGVQFRNYASNVLKEYLIKGFAIRSSEKVFYRQVLDLFATSIDYDAKNEEAKKFFATVQNKMHFAIHHHTASELIYTRVDSDKDFMGLSTFKGELPTLEEAKVAKNYLSVEELKSLNALVSGYLDFAERQAQREVKMTMKDWREHVDRILSATGEDLLIGNGRVSREMMVDKVNQEYRKYSSKTLSQVERDYLAEIKNIESIAEKGGK